MDSPTTDHSPPTEPSGAPRLGLTLLPAGVFYLLVLLFLLEPFVLDLYWGRRSFRDLAEALLTLLAIAVAGYLLSAALRRTGLPRQLGAVALLSLLAVGAHVEWVRVSQHHGLGLAGAIGLMFLLGMVLVIGGSVVLALLHLTRGRGLGWTALVVPVALAAQISLDEHLISTPERQAAAAEREEFEEVVASLTEHPVAAVVLDLEGWAAESVTYEGSVTYAGPSGAAVTVSSWSTHDYDPRRSEADYPGFLRSGCVDEDYVCEDFDDPPLSGVVFQHESVPERYTVRARLGPEVGSSVDLFPGQGAVVLLSDEVIELAHGLRTFEEEDAALVAEQITGRPRP
ncbi:hypothetical protein [Nocardiopsis valliformis]|uniref:hypothetical protein n=1 Tax=Nocardiopsis valliformis TaxID=239974 RepID=UPI0003694107|nr:hypothetical protein [Nocardiopsis valliformis]